MQTVALKKEAQAWEKLSPTEYDRTACAILDEVSADAITDEGMEAMLALAGMILRRNAPALLESRIRCAELLLALLPRISEPALAWRVCLLFLLGWLQIADFVERGPKSVSLTPDLPEGVQFPYGVSPDAITDPELRQQAVELSVRHSQEVEKWNAKQRAEGALRLLATLLRNSEPSIKTYAREVKELERAMGLAPGLPDELRRLLEQDAM